MRIENNKSTPNTYNYVSEYFKVEHQLKKAYALNINNLTLSFSVDIFQTLPFRDDRVVSTDPALPFSFSHSFLFFSLTQLLLVYQIFLYYPTPLIVALFERYTGTSSLKKL